jgi:tripartite-type tricarboxylate transporter receptor subunit TctC
MPNRRTINVIALAGVMLLLGLAPGQTEDYPSRPVRLIITTPAGSLVDVLGRLFAQDLSDRLGQTIVVDNRPGAMTQIGADALNRASPDGYTLMIVTSEATMLPFLKKSYRYDPVKDFTPIALLATSGTVIRKCRPTRLPSSSPIPKPIRGGSATAAAVSGARFTSRSRCCD